jgi:hypothetical protein
MRWTPGGPSDDIEDRRGEGGGGMRLGGGGGMRVGLGGLVVLGILSFVFKVDLLSPFLGGGGGGGTPMPAAEPRDPEALAREDRTAEFVTFAVRDIQDTWTELLPRQQGTQYERSKLVLFRDAVQSACGPADAASGPFYCPGDRKMYIDLSFYDELDKRFGAPGDFAQAYVLAHEAGHHLQNLLGIERQMRQRQRANPGAAKALSVRMELQADCFAGVWGNSAARREKLDPGDIEEGLRAAAAIGDDRIQRSAGRNPNPETFTHGSSAQRVEWFKRGFESGRMSACDTFGQ